MVSPSAHISRRIGNCIVSSIPKALRTSLWLLMVMLPISLCVRLLGYFGILGMIAEFLSPVFRVFGLSGTAPLVFVTAISLNIYSAIAVIETLSLTMREITILALMCLIAHNLPVETTVQRRTGSSVAAILITRVTAAFLGALILSLVLPADHSAVAQSTDSDSIQISEPDTQKLRTFEEFAGDAPAFFRDWSISSLKTIGMIVGIVVGLLVLQNILTEFELNKYLTRFFSPLLRLFGLPRSTHFLWLVANTLGLAYGSAVLISEVESGKMERVDADLLNRHIAVSHSLLEDTLLFAAIGVGAFWITIPRIGLAIASVWITRGVRRIRQPGISSTS